MKWLTRVLCVLFLTGLLVSVPTGCSGGKAEKLDPADYPDEVEDEEGEDGDGPADGEE